MSFTKIPILDLSLARNDETKSGFLTDLRNALLEVGFFYISNVGIEQDLFDRVCQEVIAFFDLPEEEKLRIEMKNEKSFLGYSRLGNEITARAPDWREQLDLGTPHDIPGLQAPLYHNLLAPNQWPSTQYLPTFQSVFEDYMARLAEISIFFTSLIAESLSLPATTFDHFFASKVDQGHKLKIIKYPDSGTGVGQGVGPHKDSMLTSYLLQASPHRGLQAQNPQGEWIDCPPVRGTLVVAVGQALEALTGGACASTTHRVLSPEAGKGPRYSIPFFQGVSYDSEFQAVDVPAEIMELRRQGLERAGQSRKGLDEAEFTFVKGRWNHLGEATLMNRIKSHPDVGERWYPDLLKAIRAEEEKNTVGGSEVNSRVDVADSKLDNRERAVAA